MYVLPGLGLNDALKHCSEEVFLSLSLASSCSRARHALSAKNRAAKTFRPCYVCPMCDNNMHIHIALTLSLSVFFFSTGIGSIANESAGALALIQRDIVINLLSQVVNRWEKHKIYVYRNREKPSRASAARTTSNLINAGTLLYTDTPNEFIIILEPRAPWLFFLVPFVSSASPILNSRGRWCI